MTDAATPSAAPPPQPKKKKGGPLRWLLSVFGPALVVGGAVWFVLKSQTGSDHALFLGALAGALFLIAWHALSLRMRKAGRSLMHFLKSAFWTLLFVGVAVAVVWYFFFK